MEGHVLSQWTGRTVIRSCAKLAYHHAQAIIDADEAGQVQAEEAPAPLERPHTWAQASSDADCQSCSPRYCVFREREWDAFSTEKQVMSMYGCSFTSLCTLHVLIVNIVDTVFHI